MGINSKKKKKLFTSKQKLLIVLVALVALFTIIAIALNPTGKKKVQEVKNEANLYSTFNSERDVIEYYESIYYSTEVSTEEGYDIDIYVSFKYNLYEGDESKETFFKNIYERISLVTDRKSFRLIDEAKGITIEVKCSTNGIYEVKINGDLDYYRRQDSLRSAKKAFVAKRINPSIDSRELSDLISANWNPSKVNLGTEESTYYKYSVYFDEGYEIRTIQGKVYNLVFTKNYKGNVIGGYKVGTSLDKIKDAYGVTYEETGLLGYKTNNFYVWFSEDEISIYPIYDIDYTEFEKLAKEYNEKKNPNEFMDKLTDIWPDYDLYEYNENYVKICYANKGFQFEYSVEDPIGIKIYENYWGNIRDNIEDYPNIFYSFDKNLTGEREVARRDTKIFYDDYDEENELQHSKKFQLLMKYNASGQNYSNIKIKSIDDQYPNNEFEDYFTINTYVWADDSHLVFSITGEGIYIYDAINRTINTVVSGQEQFEIQSYHRATNTMVYDGTTIKVDF